MNAHTSQILLCYKNFSKDCNVSHIGLGVTAQYTAKTLHSRGYPLAIALPIMGADDLSIYIRQHRDTARPVSHVLIMAQWIPIEYLAMLAREFPEIKFAQKCHSGVGFLQAEPPAIDLIRKAIDLETGLNNFFFATNNPRLAHSLEHMYGRPITLLPNLYWTSGREPIYRPMWNGGKLKIGAFGSLRIYKNFSTAIAAAVQLTMDLKTSSEIWINSGRNDGAGNVVYRTALSWTRDLPNVELKQLSWASWPDFKRMVGSMNILMQPSYTETFNNVTADGICEGTPSVVGPSIEWVPNSWKAEPDDAGDVSGVARRLLTDPYAVREGYHSLLDYVDRGFLYWKKFLS